MHFSVKIYEISFLNFVLLLNSMRVKTIGQKVVYFLLQFCWHWFMDIPYLDEYEPWWNISL